MIALEISPGHVRYIQTESAPPQRVYRDRLQPLKIIPLLPATAEQLATALDASKVTIQTHINRLLDSKQIERVPDSWPRQYRRTE